NNRNNNENFKWYTSIGDATSKAFTGSLPIMLVVARTGNAEDIKAQEKIATWPQAIQLSNGSMVAVKIYSDNTDALALVKIVGPKAVPGIIWLDVYGNPIVGQSIPDTVAPIQATVAQWKSTLATIDRFFTSHQSRGDLFFKNVKLREAYLEYSQIAKFKGPAAEKAQASVAKVKEVWLKIAAAALKLPAASRDRQTMLNGIRHEVKDTDYVAGFEKDLVAAMAAADASGAVADNANNNGGGATADAGALPPPVASIPDPKAGEVKPLSEAAAASTVTQDQSEMGLDVSFLSAHTNPRVREAGKIIEQGVATFKKATDDKMERGPARNELLKSAHDDFDKALNTLAEATAGKPDAAISRLSERVSMLLYASLKYQSL
ncbi:MAG TPA: hypothetical protein VKX17_21985, partial [Planctomycetota bacterium]|nr:hypothetical protein [Planctomycetota bacterium]